MKATMQYVHVFFSIQVKAFKRWQSIFSCPVLYMMATDNF